LHDRNEIGDTVHDVSLGQRCAGLLHHFFDCFSRARAVKGNSRYDCDSFWIVELEALGLPLQRDVCHHVDEQLVEFSRS
jgi:hypothetical protein